MSLWCNGANSDCRITSRAVGGQKDKKKKLVRDNQKRMYGCEKGLCRACSIAGARSLDRIVPGREASVESVQEQLDAAVKSDAELLKQKRTQESKIIPCNNKSFAG